MESRNKTSLNVRPKSSITLHQNREVTYCDSEIQDKYSEQLDLQPAMTRPKSSVQRPKSSIISTSNDQSTTKSRPKSSGLPKLSDNGPSYSRSHTDTSNRNRRLLEMLSLAETSPRSSAPFLDHSPRSAKTCSKPRPKSCHIIACSSLNKPDDHCRSLTGRVVRPKSSVEARQHHSSAMCAGRPGSSPCRQHREAQCAGKPARSPCRSASGTRSRPCSSPCRSLYKSSDCNALYLASLAKIYDISQMRKLKQLQYKTLLLRQQQLGFNRYDEYENYSRYLRGPRTQEFDEHNHRVIQQMEHSGSVKESTNKPHKVAFNNNNDRQVPRRKKYNDSDRQQRHQQGECHKHKHHKLQEQQQQEKQHQEYEHHGDKQQQQQLEEDEDKEGGIYAEDENGEFSVGNKPHQYVDDADNRNDKSHADDNKFDSAAEKKDDRKTGKENGKKIKGNKKNDGCHSDDQRNVNQKNAVHENCSEKKVNGENGDGMTDHRNNAEKKKANKTDEEERNCVERQNVEDVHGSTSRDTQNDTQPGSDSCQCEVNVMATDVSNTADVMSVTSRTTTSSGSSYTDTNSDTDSYSDTDTVTADSDNSSSSTECSCTDCNASSSDETESVADK